MITPVTISQVSLPSQTGATVLSMASRFASLPATPNSMPTPRSNPSRRR
ncbi:hypothetical protein ACVWZZ_008312 [Bradyrhizobium sp. LM6.10]